MTLWQWKLLSASQWLHYKNYSAGANAGPTRGPTYFHTAVLQAYNKHAKYWLEYDLRQRRLCIFDACVFNLRRNKVPRSSYQGLYIYIYIYIYLIIFLYIFIYIRITLHSVGWCWWESCCMRACCIPEIILARVHKPCEVRPSMIARDIRWPRDETIKQFVSGYEANVTLARVQERRPDHKPYSIGSFTPAAESGTCTKVKKVNFKIYIADRKATTCI